MAQSFWGGLFDAIGDAIADVRHKVVEEGWFGRAVTDDAQADATSFYRPVTQEPLVSFEEQWAPRAPSEAPAERARAPEGPEIDR